MNTLTNPLVTMTDTEQQKKFTFDKDSVTLLGENKKF